MAIYKVKSKIFSALDNLHLQEINEGTERRKTSVKRTLGIAKAAGTVAGGTLGAIAGGVGTRSGAGALLGAAAGGILANRLINRRNNKVYDKVSKNLDASREKYNQLYNSSNEEEKKELRDRFEKAKDRSLQMEANRIQRRQLHQQRMIKHGVLYR